MDWSNVNPVVVAKLLLELCQAEFECDNNAEPQETDKMVALILFEKFAKISSTYIFQEDIINEEGGKLVVS